jgi:hypothetical protein
MHGEDVRAKPGSAGDPPFGAGLLVLERHASEAGVDYVSPRRARTLCGKNLDGIDAVHR